TDQLLRSRLRSEVTDYLGVIQTLGGDIDRDNKRIVWTKATAGKYALWLILHEIGHIAYADRNSCGEFRGRTSTTEESFCNSFAWTALSQLYPALPNRPRAADAQRDARR